jgi:hypothetical protein
VAIDAPRELDEVIEKWHWNQEGAIDSEGILPYVRDRGVETKGMSPLKAIKEQLARENGGVRLREVENAQDVGVQSISFKKIIAPNSHHYQKLMQPQQILFQGEIQKQKWVEWSSIKARDHTSY